MDSSKGLASAVESLPQLMEEKKFLEMHTLILKATMDEAMKRDPPAYGQVEENILSGNGDKNAVIALIKDATKVFIYLY